MSGRDRPRLLLRLAHDDVALFERYAESREVVLGQLVLIRQRLDVLLLDETALGGFLEQTLGGREVVQMYRLVQLKILSLGMGSRIPAPRAVFDAVGVDLCSRQYEL